MLLTNPCTHDTRVMKEAEALSAAGAEVVVIALQRGQLPPRESMGPPGARYEIHRVEPLRSALAALDLVRSRWTDVSVHEGGPPLSLPSPVPVSILIPIPVATPKAVTTNTAPAQPGENPRWTARGGRRLLRAPKQIARLLAARVRTLRRRAVKAAGRPLFATVRRFARLFGITTAGTYRPFVRHSRALRPDFVHAHDLSTLPAAAVIARDCGSMLMYDSHELWLHRNIGNRPRWADQWLWGAIERRLVGRCAAVFTVADGICDWLRDQYGIARPILVRNAQPFKQPPQKGRELRDAVGAPDTDGLCLYAGAITVNRGLETLIDAAPLCSGARLIIMGYAQNESYLGSLRARADANGSLDRTVHFLPAVPREAILAWTASADLSIVPTLGHCLSYRFEASNKMFHSIMAGVPLVMTDHPEKRRIAEEHGVGVLFPEGDPAAMAAAITDTLADRQLMELMRARCLVAARALNWECESARLLAAYTATIGMGATGTSSASVD